MYINKNQKMKGTKNVKKELYQKMMENPLPPLPEDERIYFNIPYTSKNVAKYCHCRFCTEKKLWFTGCINSRLNILVDIFGVNKNETSEKAMKLLEEKLREMEKELEEARKEEYI